MRLGGEEDLTVILVHCSDARDMGGHYPPICYRQIGWNLDLERIARPSVGCDYLRDPQMTVYRFRRTDSRGQREDMTILNGFILPDGRTSADFLDRNPIATPSLRASRGLAQVQLVFGSDLPEEEAVRTARDVLAEFPREVLRVLLGNPQEGLP
jgi:hypothetical protein